MLELRVQAPVPFLVRLKISLIGKVGNPIIIEEYIVRSKEIG